MHHKIYITADNVDVYEIALDFNNLELLCQTCHNQEHHRQDSVEFDDNGDMVPPSSLGNIKVAGTEVGSFEKCKLKAQDGVVREVK